MEKTAYSNGFKVIGRKTILGIKQVNFQPTAIWEKVMIYSFIVSRNASLLILHILNVVCNT